MSLLDGDLDLLSFFSSVFLTEFDCADLVFLSLRPFPELNFLDPLVFLGLELLLLLRQEVLIEGKNSIVVKYLLVKHILQLLVLDFVNAPIHKFLDDLSSSIVSGVI